MISEPTVLILGAGASKTFGLPTGYALYKEIWTALKHAEGTMLGLKLQENIAISANDLMKFADDLYYSGVLSVDQFLERRDDWLRIGKLAIAAALLPRESIELLFADEPDPNWYKYLFSCMNTTFEQFGNNPLSIITFNYDRSLEQFFLTALQRKYNRPEQDCIEAIQRIPIIHVHGSLGPLYGEPGKTISYGSALKTERLDFCADSIQIIHEPSKSDAFIEARNVLSAATKVAFLGFGYNPTNMAKLLLPQCLNRMPPVSIYGTTFGLGEAEISHLNEVLTSYTQGYACVLGKSNMTIHSFLKNHPVLS